MNKPLRGPHVAYFISPHGFGHATRAVAVLQALFEICPQARASIWSTVPSFLFNELPQDRVTVLPLACDVGLVQASPLHVNMEASQQVLASFWPPDPQQLKRLAIDLVQRECDLVVCDVAALGIVAAKQVGIPAVLVENFTWDWIYSGMPDGKQFFGRFIEAFETVYENVDMHIQVDPVCHRRQSATLVDVVVRPLKEKRQVLRKKMGVKEHQQVVLITMGGLAGVPGFTKKLLREKNLLFLLPGVEEREKNVVGLGRPEQFYHPDWVFAADLVVGKLGYSTVAEVVQAGTPMAYVDRPDFPESAVLAEFLKRHVPAIELPHFEGASWLADLQPILSAERKPQRSFNGAQQIAQKLLHAFRS